MIHPRSCSGDERPRKRSKVESASSHLCARCSSIKWSSLAEKAKTNQSVDYFNEVVTESHEQLRLSFCEVCQLLAFLARPESDISSCKLKAVKLYKFFTDRTTLPYPLQTDTAILSFEPERRQLGHAIAVEPSPQAPSFVDPQRFEHENINFGLMAKWMDHCVKNHPECEPGTRSSTHTLQVIDCKKSQDVNKEQPELVALPKDGIYAALSYVWGGVDHKFPQVVRDSIKVALRLKCGYLWVDRHCITQDDNDDEKQIQIKRMDEIYSQASFTIVDAAGEDCNHGLAGVTHPRNADSVLRYAHVPGAKLTYLGTPPAEKIGSSRWASRGWTFQEGILSRRRIFFTDEQVMFQCNNMSCLESFEIPTSVLHRLDDPNKKRTAKLPDIEPLRLGSKDIGVHLMEFSKRNLTHDSDILKAFLGILNYCRKDKKYFHLHGSPISIEKKGVHLINAWYHVKPGVRNPNFPSWSWTGWKGEIKTTTRDHPDYDVRVFEIEVRDGNQVLHPMSLDGYIEACSKSPSYEMDPVIDTLIELKGKMATISFELIKWPSAAVGSSEEDNKTSMQDGAWAILPFTKDTSCYSFLYLDNEALTGICQFKLPVMVLESGKEKSDQNIVILVLREKGVRFERVGMTILWRGDKVPKAKLTMRRDKSGKWKEPEPVPQLQEFTWWQELRDQTILLQ